ncbi:MBOAT, membrane-bound O-acyltransferase family, putative [Angomonas deanei]|uniref:MBOAT, membrane-bound O-acyltransferase family, putative n=1 Tax=Angomonas deanei TaxID=59799 RepID=A0A7G2CDN2_9TRYP|nr:MBOAT, membrane-bound O-acyltransferase family, putative [Angomonas deanei]
MKSPEHDEFISFSYSSSTPDGSAVSHARLLSKKDRSLTEESDTPTPPVPFLSVEFILNALVASLLVTYFPYITYKTLQTYLAQGYFILRPTPYNCFWKWGFRYFDNADPQLRVFIEAIPFFLIPFLFLAVATRVLGACGRGFLTPARARCLGFLGFSLVFIFVLHGANMIFVIVIALTNYLLFHTLPRRLEGLAQAMPYVVFQVLQWVVHIALLILIEVYNEKLVIHHEFLKHFTNRVRWTVVYRMTVLRLIAFNYDSWEAHHYMQSSRERAMQKHLTTCVDCAELRKDREGGELPEVCRCYKLRTEYPRETGEYNLLFYFAYVLFPPLYIAGPMMSYNAFVSYLHTPTTLSRRWKFLIPYTIRTFSIVALHIIFLHLLYVCEVTKNQRALWALPHGQQILVMYYFLAHLWLKFSFIWKSARLYSIWCGVEPPEDMRRCFSNTLTVRDFWRDWHASFNLWIVRYMYIPMGGKANILYSLFPIFLFIAMWHDPALHLIKWALCIVVVFILELVGQQGYERVLAKPVRRAMAEGERTGGLTRPLARWLSRLSAERRGQLYRLLRSAGSTIVITGLIIANIIGFNRQESNTVPGDTDRSVADRTVWSVMTAAGVKVLGVTLFVVFCSVHVGGLVRDRGAYLLAMQKRKYGLQ